MKYTKTNLQKLETLFEELGYVVRYEKGSFNSGYCMVEDRNLAVVSKFFGTEGRINVLIEILTNIDVKAEILSDAALKTWKGILKNRIEDEDTNETQAELISDIANQ